MKRYEPKQMNAFQQARAPRAVSDAAFAKLKEQMADENLFFKNQTYSNEIIDSQTGVKTKIYFDRSNDVWRAEFTFPDGSTQSIEANSRNELLLAIASDHARSVVEVQEAEREANPVFKSEWHRACYRWMQSFTWGGRLAAWVEHLPEDVTEKIFAMLRERTMRLFPRASQFDPSSIEAAYVSLLDEGQLDPYENAARTNKQFAEQDAAKNAEQSRVTAERIAAEGQGYDRAMAEHEALEAAERVAEERKLAKTKKGMVELRRRALFGDKQNPFPISTGTARRV